MAKHMIMTNILEVYDLTKHYAGIQAVKGISFSVAEGTCLGLLGPNGAGKTTTIEMIEGLTEPTAGKIIYKGQAKGKHFAQEAGIQFQQTALMDYLTVRETLHVFSQLYQHSISIDVLLQTCDLVEFAHQRATTLSGGQKQRLLLALALVNNPRIVFLDEPTTGLDPQSRRHFWALIQRIKAEGKTIILTTHYMDEAQILCDKLLIIDQGNIIAEGSPNHLLNEHFLHSHIILDEKAFTLDAHNIAEDVCFNNGKVTLLTTDVEKTLSNLITNNIDLSSLKIESATLEDLFIKLTGHQLRQ